MTLHDYLSSCEENAEITVWDKDYDVETYFYEDFARPKDAWDNAMGTLAKKLSVCEINERGVTVDLSDLIEKNIDAINSAEMFNVKMNTDSLMDRINSILSGNVSEEWLQDFVSLLKTDSYIELADGKRAIYAPENAGYTIIKAEAFEDGVGDFEGVVLGKNKANNYVTWSFMNFNKQEKPFGGYNEGHYITSEAEAYSDFYKRAADLAERTAYYRSNAAKRAEIEAAAKQFEIVDGSLNKYLGKDTSVTVPDGVTSIGQEAFCGCENLESVIIPDGVTSIGEAAFYNCPNLINIAIPDGVTTIGESAFEYCENLTNIIVPDGVTDIGIAAFYDSENLESVTLPDSVTNIGSGAFNGCKSLKNITIPNGITKIGNFTFRDCSSLESVTIPEGVTSIGKSAFYNCPNLKNITIPDSVTSIGAFAFCACENLKNITIPDSVTTIWGGAFCSCLSLESVTIPDSVTDIRNDAFSNCPNLKTVFIGDRKIELDALSNNKSDIIRAALKEKPSVLGELDKIKTEQDAQHGDEPPKKDKGKDISL